MPNELTAKQQLVELIKTAKDILILPHHNPDGDALGASIALKLGLEKLDKIVTIAVTGEIADVYSFLPHFETIEKDLNINKDLLIFLNETQAKVSNISLKRVADNKLMIVVTPQSGTLTKSDVFVESGTFKCDLIIALDCSEIERLNSIYENNPSLFYEVPLINIDHHPGNTNFGKVNIVDAAASSTSEMIVSILETIGKDVPGIIDNTIATCLLTGVITDTGSFQNTNTTPKSLTVAAQLVAAGAHQQEIIKRLFKTKPLSTLRLWGRALAYIKEDRERGFAWTTLTKADYVASQATNEESGGIIDEMLKTASGMNFVLLLSEEDGDLHGSLRAINPSVDVSKIAVQFGGGGHPHAAAFTIKEGVVAENEQDIINNIRTYLD